MSPSRPAAPVAGRDRMTPDDSPPEKSADAFRTISEVAEFLDTPAHVLRFWESKFSQIKPMKRGGGRRYYRPEDVALLRGIRELLYDDGLTIKGVQKVLRERGQRHVAALAEAEPDPAPAIPDIGATLSKLEALRNRLRQG
ncbi:MerR family transcriptional regulator [Paludibacillus litoralis]|uniref:MerR family transcriptional regulator n=1 Tax=Paludibacillus litoralis TaxID=3133267 RepID=UPI0039B78DF3